MYHLRHILEPLGIDSHIPTASQEASAAEDTWKGLFPPERQGYRLRDDMDDVNRCLKCFGEVVGGMCEGCGVEYSDDENEELEMDEEGFWGMDGDGDSGDDVDGAMDQDDSDIPSGDSSGIEGEEIDRVLDDIIQNGDLPSDDDELPRRGSRRQIRHDVLNAIRRRRAAMDDRLDSGERGASRRGRHAASGSRRENTRRALLTQPLANVLDIMAEESDDDGNGSGHRQGANAYHSGSEASLGEHGDYPGGYDEDEDEESEVPTDNESYEDSFIDDGEGDGDEVGSADRVESEVDELDGTGEEDEVPRVTMEGIRARSGRRAENR
jgi:hypothetical protein